MRSKHTRYGIFVANGGILRILKYRRVPHQFTEIGVHESPARHLASRDLVSDTAGRAFNVHGPGKHAKHPRSDAHEQAEKQFADSLVKRMQTAVQSGQFDELILVADPRTLGRVRAGMGGPLEECISLQVGLDLTNLPLAKLEARISAMLSIQ